MARSLSTSPTSSSYLPTSYSTDGKVDLTPRKTDLEFAEAEREDALQLLQVFGPAFARSGRFWRSTFYCVLLGVATGFLALGFFNGFTVIFDWWSGDEYEEMLDEGTFEFGSGDWSWLYYTTGGGFAIGLLHNFPTFPDHVEGLFREVRDLHVEPKSSPIIFLTSMLSLGIGASVGPEAAMGNIGGAIGTFLGQKKNFSDRRRAIAAFAGMAGAMGALFPSPILSVLLLHELSITSRPGDSRFNAAVTAPLASFVQGQEVNAQHDFMEQVCLAGIASSTAFAIFFGLAHKTFLDPSKLKFAVYDIGDYNVWHLAAAIPMGIASGIIGVITLVLVGLFRKIKYRISIRLRNRGIPMRIIKIIIPTLGGLLFGLIAVAFPLTLGDGASQLPKVVQHSYATETTIHLPNGTDVTKHIEATLTPSILIGTLFAKILAMAISLSFGMVGGNIFPCIFAGTCAGCSITLVYPTLPITLTVPCMMAAVPSAFAPIPFSLVGIVILSFVIDGQMTAPVFIATFMSYLTNCGFGVIQGILEQQNGLQGTMTNLRNNNNHSHYHNSNSNSKTNSPIDSFSYGLLGTGGNEIKGMNSSALKDVSEIIFAKGGSYIDDDN